MPMNYDSVVHQILELWTSCLSTKNFCGWKCKEKDIFQIIKISDVNFFNVNEDSSSRFMYHNSKTVCKIYRVAPRDLDYDFLRSEGEKSATAGKIKSYRFISFFFYSLYFKNRKPNYSAPSFRCLKGHPRHLYWCHALQCHSSQHHTHSSHAPHTQTSGIPAESPP